MDKCDHKAHCIVYEKIPKNELITGVCRENIVNAIAAALRQEANEAAWDGFEKGEESGKAMSYKRKDKIYKKMTDTYGPHTEGDKQ